MVVQVLLAEEAVAADGQPVVAAEDDEGVVVAAARPQRVEGAADLGVQEGDGGVVVGQVLPDDLRRARPGSEAFVTASLLFCVGPLTVVGSIQNGLTGDYQALATKAMLDGFASIAIASTLGWGVALAAGTVLVIQGALSLGAGLFKDILPEGGEALAALTSAGGVLIIGISLKLLALKDVKVGNFLPALVLAPALVGLVSLFR